LRMQETEKNSPRTKQKNNYLHKNTIKPRTRERKKEKEQEEKECYSKDSVLLRMCEKTS
jgi:hypothetical protein